MSFIPSFRAAAAGTAGASPRNLLGAPVFCFAKKIFAHEILRLRRPAGGSAQDDEWRVFGSAQDGNTTFTATPLLVSRGTASAVGSAQDGNTTFTATPPLVSRGTASAVGSAQDGNTTFTATPPLVSRGTASAVGPAQDGGRQNLRAVSDRQRKPNHDKAERISRNR